MTETTKLTTPLMEDGLPDDRVTCESCNFCDTERLYCRTIRMHTIPELKMRCLKYVPRRYVQDQRTGRERWPTLDADIAELRRLEATRR